jgi:hypothetical protein
LEFEGDESAKPSVVDFWVVDADFDGWRGAGRGG